MDVFRYDDDEELDFIDELSGSAVDSANKVSGSAIETTRNKTVAQW